MYLNKSNKGIGWYAVVQKNYMGEKQEKGEFINFIFKKGAEPEDEKMEGDLFFIDSYGNKRLVLPFIDEYNGHRSVKFRLMDVLHQDSKNESQMMGGAKSNSGKSVNIESDDLPFY